ncbi:hypothetical protein TWF481_008852 [Arthrobotrys musiformis]|uniref:Uncharacterized protein n=1 Tax=Arthrobotrys musiformis TaxID=47236 RepID=A0AAV9W8F1_9PEZI
MSRFRGTGFLRPHSLTLFLYVFFILVLHSRTVPAVPIFKDIELVHRRNANFSILCTTKSTTTPLPTDIETVTNIKTIIETTLTTEIDFITTTIIDGEAPSSNSELPVEATSTLTTIQTGGPVVSDIGTEPGYIIITSEYTTYTTLSSSDISSPTSYSTLSRLAAITMIASLPVAAVPSDEPVEKPVPTSSYELPTVTTSSEPNITSSSTTSEVILSTASTAYAVPIERTTISSYSSILYRPTSVFSSTTTISPIEFEEPTSMASNIIIPIETPQPSLDSEVTPLPQLSSLVSTILTSTSPLASLSSSTPPPKTGYILTGIIISQPSDIPAGQSTRIELDGGVSMPTSTGVADLNGPPELVFRGHAGRGVSISIGVWGFTGIIAVMSGIVI